MVHSLTALIKDLYGKLLWTLAVAAVIYLLKQPLLPTFIEAICFGLFQLAIYLSVPRSDAPSYTLGFCYNLTVNYALFTAIIAKHPLATMFASVGLY